MQMYPSIKMIYITHIQRVLETITLTGYNSGSLYRGILIFISQELHLSFPSNDENSKKKKEVEEEKIKKK